MSGVEEARIVLPFLSLPSGREKVSSPPPPYEEHVVRALVGAALDGAELAQPGVAGVALKARLDELVLIGLFKASLDDIMLALGQESGKLGADFANSDYSWKRVVLLERDYDLIQREGLLGSASSGCG